MLVLDRRPKETIHIGPNIVIKVLKVQGGERVKIGITAPDDMLILRGEHVRRT